MSCVESDRDRDDASLFVSFADDSPAVFASVFVVSRLGSLIGIPANAAFTSVLIPLHLEKFLRWNCFVCVYTSFGKTNEINENKLTPGNVVPCRNNEN